MRHDTATRWMGDALAIRERDSLKDLDVNAELNAIAQTVGSQTTESLVAAGGWTKLIEATIDRRFPEPQDPMLNDLGIATNPACYRRYYFRKQVQVIRLRAGALFTRR